MLSISFYTAEYKDISFLYPSINSTPKKRTILYRSLSDIFSIPSFNLNKFQNWTVQHLLHPKFFD